MQGNIYSPTAKKPNAVPSANKLMPTIYPEDFVEGYYLVWSNTCQPANKIARRDQGNPSKKDHQSYRATAV